MAPKTNTEKGKIRRLEFKDSDLLWIDINFPTEKSMAYLRRKFKFHHLDLEDCLSENQRPKIDEYSEYLFLVLHVPVSAGRPKHIKNSELHIFIGQGYVVTIHEGNSLIRRAFERCRKKKRVKEEYMSKGSGYLLYMLVDDVFEGGFPLLDTLSKHTNELENEVFSNHYTHDRLREILFLKKDIIRRIIMPQRAIVAQLEHRNKKFLPEKLDVYFDDIVDKIEKIWNNLENLKELVASIQETNESIISHNTNNVIKILTLLSFTMLPLTFITGFYGMNVSGLPFANHPSATYVVSGVILFIAVFMYGYFRYKKWF